MLKIRIARPRKQIRKDSKTIAIYGSPDRGDGLDHNKWYRCWNCGFLDNTDRNALGDSQSRDGVILSDYAQNPDNSNKEAVLGGNVVALENDSEGNPKETVYSFMVGPNNGCSFCGSLNYRSDY